MAESFNANTEVSGLKVSDILLSHPSLPNSLCLGPRSTESPAHLISCEANRIPFVNQNLDPSSWADCLRAWPNPPEDWVSCYGQALYSLPGSKLIPQEASKWFSIFFQGLDNPLFFPYTESEHFENPVSFRLDSFADDTSTRQLYSIMVRPCFLPVGMSTSNRIIKPGYESYQPVVAARQLGLGQVSPHFFLHILTESRADLPDVLTSQRCYSFFDALVIPIPHNLSFTSSTDDFEAWWAMWKTHAFRRALGPLLKQLDAEYDIPAEQTSTEEISSEDTQSSRGDSSSGTSGENTTPSQPDLPPSASKKRSAPEPASSQASPKAGQGGLRTKSRCIKRARKTPQTSSSDQEISNTDDTSSGEVKEVVMPSTTLDLATSKSGADKAATLATPSTETQEPIASSSAAPMVLGEGYDLSRLLTFDPDFIEPAASKASEESGPSATHGQLQQLKALLSSSIETLVEDTEGIKSILEDIQPHLPVTLQVKLWPVVTLSAYKSRVTLARQRIGLRHAQLPLKADIADKCQRLNEKKATLDAKTDTSVSTAELEVLRKELEDLEERVRVTKQLVQDKEALIAHSHEEAEGLKAELKTDLAEIRALNKQLVTGQDEDDEAEIAEVDRVRASALRALEAFLQ
ncbi:hypothetical protein QYE76_054103 [Lolium multiflorum]|uniref:Uncharacterized protein n=1 Tax=Lolium multiflorum TaxID=4521 RepID=A0AAD8SXM5_LOLMU|nr:hypothetical protein QYE76_054103 [Lolium multiflorum]